METAINTRAAAAIPAENSFLVSKGATGGSKIVFRKEKMQKDACDVCED
jgi:hypothetical protein